MDLLNTGFDFFGQPCVYMQLNVIFFLNEQRYQQICSFNDLLIFIILNFISAAKKKANAVAESHEIGTIKIYCKNS